MACSFSQPGVFHFSVKLYTDEQRTNLKFETDSKAYPGHWFVNGASLPDEGLSASLDTCYTIRYSPPQAFLEENGLTNQVLYAIVFALLDQLLS